MNKIKFFVFPLIGCLLTVAMSGCDRQRGDGAVTPLSEHEQYLKDHPEIDHPSDDGPPDF